MRILLAWGIVLSAIGATQEIRLVEVPDRGGISFAHRLGAGGNHITESGGSGGAWIDYDVDGGLDLLLVNGLPARDSAPADGEGHALFRNVDSRFERAPGHSGIEDRTWGAGAAVADVDNDGFPDLLITALGVDRFYRNNGDGTFTVTTTGVEDDGWGTSATFTDWDGDGFVDLYVARYVAVDLTTPRLLCFYRGIEVFCGPKGREGLTDLFYRNDGRGGFERWFEAEIDPMATAGFALVAADCDNDARPEIYVANDSQVNLLYRRTEGGGVEDWALFGGSGYSGDGREQAGMAAAAGDFNGDGLTDLFVTNFQNDHNTLYLNLGDCNFEDATARYGLAASGLPYMGWGAQWVDLDGDADLDLAVANGHIHPELDSAGMESYAQRNLVYVNQLRETGVATFVEVGDATPGDDGPRAAASSRALLEGDFDNDGDADLLVTNVNAEPQLLRNDGPIRSPAVRLTLIGRDSNRSAYGARIRIAAAGTTQVIELRGSEGYVASNDPRVLAHLPGGVADELEIVWPSGHRTRLSQVYPGWLVVDEARGVIARRTR